MNYKLKVKIIERFRTQADFAERVREHDTYISMVVRGRRKLGAEKQRAWADALHCDLEEIFGD